MVKQDIFLCTVSLQGVDDHVSPKFLIRYSSKHYMSALPYIYIDVTFCLSYPVM